MTDRARRADNKGQLRRPTRDETSTRRSGRALRRTTANAGAGIDHASLTKRELIARLKDLEAEVSILRERPKLHRRANGIGADRIHPDAENRTLRGKRPASPTGPYFHADLFDAAPVGYVTLDTRDRIREINVTGARLLGYEPVDLLGKSFTAYLSKEQSTAFGAHRRRALETGQRQSLELRVERENGARIDIRLETVPSEGINEAEAWSRSVMIDITLCKRAEEAFLRERDLAERLIATAPAIVLLLDAEGRIVSANPFMEQVSGYGLPEIKGRDWCATFVPVNEQKNSRMLFVRAIAGRTIRNHVGAIVTKDGKLRFIEWNATKLINPWRDLHGLLLIGLDITERRRLEEQARLHLQQLAHVARVSTLGELASGLAHELNQPLMAIAAYTEGSIRRLKADPNSSPELLAAMNEVVTQTRRAGAIIRHLRDYITNGEMHCTAVDVNQLVRSTVDLNSHDAQQKGVAVHLDLIEHLPQAYVDPIQIEQVILNLLQNALAAITRGGQSSDAVVIIRTRLGRDGDEIEVALQDTGPGVPNENLERVFDPFFTTTGGMGLGLAISRTIIEAHGGKLCVMPNLGRGTTFWFTVPVRRAGRND